MPSPSPNTRSWASSSPDDTERLGAALAAVLAAGDVVHVSGELGVGKTVFVRGACRALGVTGPVTSPTYTVGNLYRTGRVPVAHPGAQRGVCSTTGPRPSEGRAGEPRIRVAEP